MSLLPYISHCVLTCSPGPNILRRRVVTAYIFLHILTYSYVFLLHICFHIELLTNFLHICIALISKKLDSQMRRNLPAFHQLQEVLEAASVSDRQVFLTLCDALNACLLSCYVRDDANVSMWPHAIHVLHEMARFFSLGTVSSTLLLLETTISCMCGLSQCNLKSFLDDTGTLLVLGRRFLGERHHMLRFRAPGQHIHIVWLLHCIAASRGLALISFQYNAGKRRRKHACKKICCFPPTIQAALRDKGTAREKA